MAKNEIGPKLHSIWHVVHQQIFISSYYVHFYAYKLLGIFICTKVYLITGNKSCLVSYMPQGPVYGPVYRIHSIFGHICPKITILIVQCAQFSALKVNIILGKVG